ncbi:DUF3817 domain-containing protein [Rhodococcus antarcticus]|jgi:integral membrane protein|uniref:DUF3817 domain-containing protein n=1 Tax=Rhodococcus antarcticus TaxID=2987751 RepID=A0ABY6P276_9NOCA|nr:DUF3817 domain-containing protein [Rhodococcus antarcticus]UZJ25623.1 DUF3817 domain-containing protein [Rhodococcus antarcticus]
MASALDVSTPAARFRLVAVAEAVSWAGLLLGMVLKYVVQTGAEGGVPVFGSIHGAVFTAYVVIALLSVRSLRWDTRTTLLALVASIPPFGSVVFERWAVRTGRLGELSTAVRA